ncbi:glycosyltransferase family 9 protein [Anaerovibrio lipolyticus]|uniref:glycosyltransferase family 9 protein n=1 Tax=Anaerovibrio lipolyticus TaxID=82374 RepID=UPI003AF32A5B
MDYFIGSCSAPLHIAAAVGCPSMAFYGPTSPKKWAPLHKCKYIFHKHPCNPCDRRVCQELCVKKFSRLHHSAS